MGNLHPIRAILAVVCLLAVLLGLCAFALPCQYGDTYLGELPYKQRLLEETSGRRIILIGGSSIPFALNSQLLEAVLPGWQVVDFGLYADLGTTAMLDFAVPYIRESDLVILVPEQDQQSLSTWAGGESLWQACDGDFARLLRLKPDKWGSLLGAFPAFAGKKLRYTLLGAPAAEGIYCRAAFNERGDVESSLRSGNLLPGGWQTAQPILFRREILSSAFVEECNAFARLVESRNAEIVYHFPPMNAAAIPEGEDIDGYYQFLADQLDFPILGNPHQAVLDSGWFYDTNFHLNQSGSMVFTRLLAEDLKVYWKDTSPTLLSLPAMPAPLSPEIMGDDRDENCFLYDAKEEGWVITGVTPVGAAAEELILPTHHEGLPVTGIDQKALQGLSALRQLTVQGNISSLWDGMFLGCTALDTLILTGENPALCAVGSGLMEGASFSIRVPATALDSYRRSYFWQQYEPWLQG